MKKTGLLLLGGLVLVLAVAAYIKFRPSTPAATSLTPSPTVSPSTSSEPATSQSLRELFASGKSQKCTFTSTSESGSYAGTVYIANQKMRGDFSGKADGLTAQSHMLIDNHTSYVWTDGQAQGVKLSYDTLSPSPPAGSAPSENFNPDQKFDYHCSTWSVDPSVFTLPTSVKFSDISALVPGQTSPGATVPAFDKCSACGFLTGDQKTQCLSSLGCSN